MQVAYSLSSDEKFDPEGRTGFKYRRFYNGLLDHLDALTPKQRSIVITFWNKYVCLSCLRTACSCGCSHIFPADVNPASSLPPGVKASAEEMVEQGELDDDDDGDEWNAVPDNEIE